MTTASTRTLRPARRTAGVTYAVRDIAVLADQIARTGKQMLYLNIGDPNLFDFAPPPHMVEAVHRAMKENLNGYAPSSGISGAIEAVRAEALRHGIQSIQHVFITSGASEAIDLALSALADGGDNVLAPAPGYPLYSAVLARLDVEARPYYLDESNDWQPDVDDIASKIDSRTRAIVLINPNNPTGAVYSRATLEKLCDLAVKRNIVLFSDEIYDKLLMDGAKHVSTASITSEAKVVTFNGLSKGYVVPGFRIGWGVVSGPGDEMCDYCDAIRKLERARLCANHPEQYAIQPALEGPQTHLVEMMQKLTRRRDIVTQGLNAIPGISCVKPRGAFYAFPKLDIDVPDLEFVKRVLQETGVVLVHGSGFAQKPGTEHFRVVFLPPDDVLRRATQLIGEVVAHYRR
ncbi:MAG: aminotransferase class I/II-fold pyridoxal phosphate-dependent enzyme [Phycisphaerales bacterium]|nr:aminotransferase class I/II-fold pyridoxal phosphate-dependent enzyme [Phycisphaerales bacterium]